MCVLYITKDGYIYSDQTTAKCTSIYTNISDIPESSAYDKRVWSFTTNMTLLSILLCNDSYWFGGLEHSVKLGYTVLCQLLR